MKPYKYESGFSHEGKMVPDAEDGTAFYLASDVAALESAAVASALRVRELENELRIVAQQRDDTYKLLQEAREKIQRISFGTAN
jgi:hypothetical protein